MVGLAGQISTLFAFNSLDIPPEEKPFEKMSFGEKEQVLGAFNPCCGEFGVCRCPPKPRPREEQDNDEILDAEYLEESSETDTQTQQGKNLVLKAGFTSRLDALNNLFNAGNIPEIINSLSDDLATLGASDPDLNKIALQTYNRLQANGLDNFALELDTLWGGELSTGPARGAAATWGIAPARASFTPTPAMTAQASAPAPAPAPGR